MFYNGNWILRVHTYLFGWRKTKFFCIISIFSQKINVKINKYELSTFYWLPKLRKNPFKSRFISNSSHCPTNHSFKAYCIPSNRCQRSCIKYSEAALSNSNVSYFWSIKNSSEVIEKLRLCKFQGSQVSSFSFSLYTPHCHIILFKQKWCPLVHCVSTKSQKRTSVLQTKRAF